MKIVTLQLLTHLCEAVCISDEKGRFDPILLSAASPTIYIDQEIAEIAKDSAHGDVLEIVEPSNEEADEMDRARAEYEELTGKPASTKLKLPGLLDLIEKAKKLREQDPQDQG